MWCDCFVIICVHQIPSILVDNILNILGDIYNWSQTCNTHHIVRLKGSWQLSISWRRITWSPGVKYSSYCREKTPLAPWHKWENPPLVPRVSCKGGAARNAAAVKILSVIKKKHWVCTWTKDLGVYFCTFVLLRWILPGFPTGSRLSCPTCYIHTSSLTFHPTWIFLDELKFKVGRISSGKCVTLQSVGCINQDQIQWRL